ncbi:MAG: hydroxyethylthiazole kinase [Candidatus Ratteibacteria bacterium]|jgi:hydroxyethylthiazole kinase
MNRNYPDAGNLLERVRNEKPIVHHITNWVTIYDCAQAVKTLEGSPVMAHAPEEVAEMTSLSSALVLNIGTLTKEIVASMLLSAVSAQKKNIPVVLDVCGAGATKMRNEACQEILQTGCVNVVKGNASEIASIAGEKVITRGVDSGTISADMTKIAQNLSDTLKITVAVTGKTDIVCGTNSSLYVKNGHPMMATVVGTGCMAASLIGTFCAVEPNFSQATAAALACFGIAGEIASLTARTPLSFKHALLDALSDLTPDTIKIRTVIESF